MTIFNAWNMMVLKFTYGCVSKKIVCVYIINLKLISLSVLEILHIAVNWIITISIPENNLYTLVYEQFVMLHMSIQFILFLDKCSLCIKSICFTRFDLKKIYINAIELDKDNPQHGSPKWNWL